MTAGFQNRWLMSHAGKAGGTRARLQAERLDPRDVNLLIQHALSYAVRRRFPEALRRRSGYRYRTGQR
jgi:hypothetical protein